MPPGLPGKRERAQPCSSPLFSPWFLIMAAANDVLCLHCERQPAGTGLGLCQPCHAVKGIRVLYLRRRGWTPAWEAHLRRLAERAKKRLSLFDDQRTL